MNIAFISYWGVEDPLCVATVLPHVRLLHGDARVNKVFLLTFERTPTAARDESFYSHLPVVQRQAPLGLHFFLSFIKVGLALWRLHRQRGLDGVVCRSVFAGVVGWFLFKTAGVPFTVESYEPHEEYMVENGVWTANGWKSWIVRFFDRLVRRDALRLYPVAENFARRLISENVAAERIEVLPCTIASRTFLFDPKARSTVRTDLGLNMEGGLVGIYVGKFGGMYLDVEAQEVLNRMLEAWPDLFLILLSDPESATCESLMNGVNGVRVRALLVPPDDVSSYLSASDFGLVLTRPTRTSQYLSPIKIAEYLFNGLPVFLPEGIGDDSEVLARRRIGVTFSLPLCEESLAQSLQKLRALATSRLDLASQISKEAEELRGFQISVSAYDRLLSLFDSVRQTDI